jgi:uncharacterized protein YqeY
MSIKNDIHERMVQAMKAKDKELKTMWATVLSALQNDEKGGKHPHEYDDRETVVFLKQQIKQRDKSAVEYDKVGSTVKAESERAESTLIASLLPESEKHRDRLQQEALAIRADVDGRSFGAVMKAIKTGDSFTENTHVVIGVNDAGVAEALIADK